MNSGLVPPNFTFISRRGLCVLEFQGVRKNGCQEDTGAAQPRTKNDFDESLRSSPRVKMHCLCERERFWHQSDPLQQSAEALYEL